MHKYRMAFLGGLAAGFVVGARAGRERYEQLKKLARSAADNPAVQQAAGALQAQTTELAKAAGQKVSDQVRERVPRFGGKRGDQPDANGSIHGHTLAQASTSTDGEKSGRQTS